jgi:hypothetical protein
MHLVTPAQREQITREIQAAEAGLSRRSMYRGDGGEQVDLREMATSDPRFPSPDPAILRESVRRDTETLRRGSPPQYSGYQKNQIWEMVQAAQQTIQEGMPTDEQMEKPTYGNVQHFVQHEEYTRQAQMIYQNGLRILDPDLEGIAVESLRPAQGHGLNIKAWEQGYAKISWTPEEQLADELARLDDSMYLAVLQLQLSGITTPRLIQAQLGISQATYEACMARLKDATREVTPETPTPAVSKATVKWASTPGSDVRKVRAYLAKHGATPVNTMSLRLKMSRARIADALAELEKLTADTAA